MESKIELSPSNAVSRSEGFVMSAMGGGREGHCDVAVSRV
jgi:hypothetical protein